MRAGVQEVTYGVAGAQEFRVLVELAHEPGALLLVIIDYAAAV